MLAGRRAGGGRGTVAVADATGALGGVRDARCLGSPFVFHPDYFPAGKVAIAGGVEQTNASGQAVLSTAGTNISLVRSSPSSPTRWTAGVENTGTTDRFFKVTVICATVAP